MSAFSAITSTKLNIILQASVLILFSLFFYSIAKKYNLFTYLQRVLFPDNFSRESTQKRQANSNLSSGQQHKTQKKEPVEYINFRKKPDRYTLDHAYFPIPMSIIYSSCKLTVLNINNYFDSNTPYSMLKNYKNMNEKLGFTILNSTISKSLTSVIFSQDYTHVTGFECEVLKLYFQTSCFYNLNFEQDYETVFKGGRFTCNRISQTFEPYFSYKINNEYKINLRNDKTSFLSYSMIGDFVLSQILDLFGFSKKDYSYDANPLVSLMQNERKLRRWLISKLALFLKYQIKLYPRNENNDLVYISDLCVNNSAEKELLQRILQAPQLRQQLGKNFSSQSHDDLSANLDEAINSILIKKSNMSPFKLRFEP